MTQYDISKYNVVIFKRAIIVVSILLSFMLASVFAIIFKEIESSSNSFVLIQQYSIIVTLIVLPLVVRWANKKLKLISDETDVRLKNMIYRKVFSVRLAFFSLFSIAHIVLFYFTQLRNFGITSVLIIVFTYFICSISKSEEESLK